MQVEVQQVAAMTRSSTAIGKNALMPTVSSLVFVHTTTWKLSIHLSIYSTKARHSFMCLLLKLLWWRSTCQHVGVCRIQQIALHWPLRLLWRDTHALRYG